MIDIKVLRARIEEVQPLAASFRRDVEGERAAEPPLPKGAVFWIARSADGRALGYAAGTLRQDGVVLGPFYVLPEQRRAGVGQQLLDGIQRWAQGARIPLVEVSVAADNTAGVRFLEAAGFTVRRHLMARQPHPASAAPPEGAS